MTKPVDASRLEPLFEEALRDYMEKATGPVIAPDALKRRFKWAVSQWLKHHESEYRDIESWAEADAIRDLRLNLIDGEL